MKVLVVDDEKSIRLSLYMGVQKLGVEVDQAADGEEAVEMFRDKKYDIVLLDIKMPKMDGITALKHIRQIDKKCKIIMMTHLSEVRLAVEAMKAGASEYFTKPFSIMEMTEIVKDTMAMHHEDDSAQEDRKMIGRSQAVQDIYNKVDKLSQLKVKTSILVNGESGTGKEVVAKMIAEKCAPGRPYVAINCAAIPTHLQESELFGHEKGAFSDAKEMRVGLFEHAKDGVMFLDEIGEMSLDLQAKLLRVIQERQFRRIGGNKVIEFDALLVAATNKDLKLEVEKGSFRKDLYYRLNIVPITIPPLRERKADLEALTQHFIKHYNALFGKSVQTVTSDLMERFMEYDWPGNVRELKNIIERLMIFSESDELTSVELPYEISSPKQQSDSAYTELERAEQEAVLRALSEYGWNITRAAESLSISRLTLRRKIDKYGLKK